jgi:hypothetical protein
MTEVQDHVGLSKEAQGWLIVCCGFFVEALAMGGRSLFLVVLLIFEKDPVMHWTRRELSALMACVHVCNGISTPMSGMFCARKI